MKVLAAMSGGVDSAVAAARAVDDGHDVTGVHFALSPDPEAGRGRGCCTLSDARDAQRAAAAIGIPFYVWDVAAQFRQEVIDDFVAEYAAGRTPNPCIRCNERIKFAAVLDRAVALGFDAVCTGHYARLDTVRAGEVRLRRGRDHAKDQSYVLATVGPQRLGRALLPLGSDTKSDVRAEAHSRGLTVARKPDSYDICFIPDGDVRGWLESRVAGQPGDIVDVESGEVVGRHGGARGFTVGQRRGLDLGQPAGHGEPRYVIAVDVVENRVDVGRRALLEATQIACESMVWFDRPASGSADLTVQIRAHGAAVSCRVEVTPHGAVLHPANALTAVAPGQTAVLYAGETVVGAGAVVSSTSTTAFAGAKGPSASAE